MDDYISWCRMAMDKAKDKAAQDSRLYYPADMKELIEKKERELVYKYFRQYTNPSGYY